ncbi:MAG: TolC family protein [Alphaproteobacteria bacterium]|nr:TolC family protein [Alphaproteobacteria bacterium]
MKNLVFLVPTLTLLLSGCAWLTPDYDRPALEMPEEWAAQHHNEASEEKLQDWWKEYSDPVLEELIGEALVNNGDLLIASARVQQAQAQYNYAFGNQLPLLAATGLSSRSKLDVKDNPLLSDKPSNMGLFGGMLSWELDLWGKLASASESSKSTFLATGYNQDAMRLSVASSSAQLYFSILALDANIRITQDTIRSREESYRIIRKQFERQAVNELVLRQSEAELEGTRAQLPKLLEQKDKAESALSVLLGRSPREIMESSIPRGYDFNELPVPPLFPAHTPSSLLERRPDIAAAEEMLIASNFNIGVARAAYFPTISLSSLLGISSVDVANLHSGTMQTWSMGATLAGPIIDFGRTDSGVDMALAKNQELLASYKNSVRSAFKEVKDALSEQTYSETEEQAQAREEGAVKESLRLANLRYTSGYSSYIEVLDAQRNLYGAQVALVAAKLKRLNASVNLYKALGGGWNTGSSEEGHKPG